MLLLQIMAEVLSLDRASRPGWPRWQCQIEAGAVAPRAHDGVEGMGSARSVRESEGLKRALDLVPPACYI
jgi:hypothetical protein